MKKPETLFITPKEACKKHKREPIYEVAVYDFCDRSKYVYQSDFTINVYLTYEKALIAARQIAKGIAFDQQLEKLDDPDYNTEKIVYLVCIKEGKRISKNGAIYGFSKIVYAISTQTKEVTEKFVMDKRFKDLQVCEYTEQPKLTKDMFYQWD